jgi:uncharacterized protein YggE
MKRAIIIFLVLFPFRLLGQPGDGGHYIAVIGEASGSYVPDMIVFNFSINATDKKQLEAVESLNKQVEVHINKLVSLGVKAKEIKLTNYGLDDAVDYSGEKPKNIGYEATESFELELKYSVGIFNMIVDSVSVTKMKDLSFSYLMTFSDSLKNVIKNELIKKASDNAEAIAVTLAKSRNVRLKSIFSIEYTGGNFDLYGKSILPPPPPPAEYYRMHKMKANEIAERVSMKGIDLDEQVRIIYVVEDIL